MEDRELQYSIEDVLPKEDSLLRPGIYQESFDPFDRTNQILLGATLRTSNFAGRTATVKAGENINSALETLRSAGGGVLFLQAGTYKLTEDIVGGSEISIRGEGRDQTILDFQGNAKGIKYIGTAGAIIENFVISDLTVQNSNHTAGIDIDFADFWRMENVRVTSCDQKGLRINHSRYFVIDNIRNDTNTGNGIELKGDATRATRFFSFENSDSVSNTGDGYYFLSDTNADITDFLLTRCSSNSNTSAGFKFEGGATSNPDVDASLVSCLADGNEKGFSVDAEQLVFLGCKAVDNTNDGFRIPKANNKLFGCQAGGNGTDFNILQANTVFVGNVVEMEQGTVPSDKIVINDLALVSYLNLNGNTRTEKQIRRMKNVTGGNLGIGDLVVFNSGADGDEITTTTTAGDDKVFGMALGGSSSLAPYVSYLTEGYTQRLKANGTTAIAVGDYLSTFTTAGIAKKASAGETVFAIALEAYSTADSNGVIDAYILPWRMKI